MPDKEVCRAIQPSKSDVSAALAAAWSRTAMLVGKGTLADAIGADTKTIDRALTGPGLPELHTALFSLRADPLALDEVFAALGFESPRLRVAKRAEPMEIAAGLGHTLTELVERYADGKLCHNDKLALSAILRPLIPHLSAIVDEADASRGAHSAHPLA